MTMQMPALQSYHVNGIPRGRVKLNLMFMIFCYLSAYMITSDIQMSGPGIMRTLQPSPTGGATTYGLATHVDERFYTATFAALLGPDAPVKKLVFKELPKAREERDATFQAGGRVVTAPEVCLHDFPSSQKHKLVADRQVRARCSTAYAVFICIIL